MTRTVVGHFVSVKDAKRAVANLEAAGFARNEVSYVARDERGLADAVPIAIPGFGAAIAGGPIARELTAGTAGGLLGALADIGVPSQDAQGWADRVARGGSLVIVAANEETVSRAEQILATPPEGAHEGDVSKMPDATAAHEEFPNFGSDGGSSQWSQRVLRVEGDQSVVAERTISRDKSSKRFNEEGEQK